MDFHKLMKSFGFAFYGIVTALEEQNMRVHFFSAIVVIIVSFITGINKVEWMLIIIIIALVISAEMINTAIENMVDLVSPDYHPLAKKVKDLAAGAVLIFAMASVIVGLMIFLPKWF